MNKIEWTNDLSVGIDLLDDQHKTWIEHYNHAVETIEAQHNVTQISHSLQFLFDYTEIHFSTEEQAMTKSAYPELEEHKAKHNALRTTLSAMAEEFIEDGATNLLAQSVKTFLGNWLIKHIQEVDMRFAAFIRES